MEGWGLYAENPLISDDTDVYDGEPMKKYGMLKWQVSESFRNDGTGCASGDSASASIKGNALEYLLV